jgi:signal transduction histidine kinase
MLEVVDDALRRMAKVQERLSVLKGETAPVWQDLELCRFLNDLCRQLGKKLAGIEIKLDCHTEIRVHTDPGLLSPILENVLLNVLEAGSDGTIVRIDAGTDDEKGQAVIEILDNGPGIPQELLPDALFEPFKTTKPNGSGIGLWQAKQLVTGLRGTISADNLAEGGARFTVKLPLAAEA